ncbi:tail fiber protein [uncultured Draconibacterium sp.]|uniref:phage tail protein n=1 Tax=uncultured Draconibacterium sp. TaxID=1573823 RepID=UPI002AA5F19A|nr:tail fiber protein [uncultured Draconibacterium sp.]
MSEPFLAEIRIVGFNFAPRGWAFCDGQILPINQNQSLYSLLGTTYGGDGRTSFALPDFRGRVPVHPGNTISQGQKNGEETHTLSANELPAHDHAVNIENIDGSNIFSGTPALSKAKFESRFATESKGSATMNPNSISNAGGGQAHENMQPSLALNFCIALQGLFPSRN